MQRGWLRSEREADVLLNLENSGRAKAKALSLRARVEKRKKTVSKKRARILKIHSTRFIVGVFLNGKKKEKERKERKESGRDRSKSELTKSSFQTVSFDRSRSTRKKRKKKRRNVIFSLSLFFSRRSDTLESSNAPLAFLGSIHQIVASFTAARFLLRFDRAYVALGEDPLRIRIYVRARAPSCDYETAEEGSKNAGPSE